MTPTVTEFITARLDEIEHLAHHAATHRDTDIARGVFIEGHEPDVPDTSMSWTDDATGGAVVQFGPEFVLERTRIDRELLHTHQQGLFDCTECGAPTPCATLRWLATAWSHHPDYQPEWRLP